MHHHVCMNDATPTTTHNINEENFRTIARDLFHAQCGQAASYYASLAEHGFADDDIDYNPAMAECLVTLQALAYDVGTADDLVWYLTSTKLDETRDIGWSKGVVPINISALDNWSDQLKEYQLDVA